MDKIVISVIMGIYNCEKTLADSIDSLLNQTFKDFELIMCDDNSNDHTYEIARKYADKYKKIILLKNNKNRGLNYTLNYCLSYAKGEFIARQDGDDISLPDRFEKEREVLETYKDISFVSCAMIHFNENGDYKTSKVIPRPKKRDFIYNSPFAHPACMLRKSVLIDVGGYTISKYLLRVEDYHLWFKLYSKGYIGYNLQTPLYKWRDDFNAYKRRNLKNRLNEVYVRFIGFRMLKLPVFLYVFCLRPLVVLILPYSIYKLFHDKS